MSINRDAVEEAKDAKRRRRAAERARQVTDVVADFEIEVEDLALADPHDARLRAALNLLRDKPDEAIVILADMLGEEGFRQVMARITGQQVVRGAVEPQQPAAIPVFDAAGNPQGSVVVNSPRYRELVNDEGYEPQRQPDGGVVLRQTRRPAPAGQQREALPAGTAEQHAAPRRQSAPGHADRRSWSLTRQPRQG